MLGTAKEYMDDMEKLKEYEELGLHIDEIRRRCSEKQS